MSKEENNEKDIQFAGIGDNDGIEYHKADAIKMCRLGSNYALSFYQIDYNAIVNAITKRSKIEPNDTKLIPVGKIVMDEKGFLALKEEIQTLEKNIQKQNMNKK